MRATVLFVALVAACGEARSPAPAAAAASASEAPDPAPGAVRVHAYVMRLEVTSLAASK